MQVVLGQEEVEKLAQTWVNENLTGVYGIKVEIFDNGINLDLDKLADEQPPDFKPEDIDALIETTYDVAPDSGSPSGSV